MKGVIIMATYIKVAQGFGTMNISLGEIYNNIEQLSMKQQQSIALALAKAYGNNAMALAWALARDAAEQFGGTPAEYFRGGALAMAQRILKLTTRKYAPVVKWRSLSTYMLTLLSREVIDYVDSNFPGEGNDAGLMTLVGRMTTELLNRRIPTGEAAIDTGAYVYVYDRLQLHSLLKDPATFFQSDGSYRVIIEIDAAGNPFRGFGNHDNEYTEKTTYGFKQISEKIEELFNEYMRDRERYDEELINKYNVPVEED